VRGERHHLRLTRMIGTVLVLVSLRRKKTVRVAPEIKFWIGTGIELGIGPHISAALMLQPFGFELSHATHSLCAGRVLAKRRCATPRARGESAQTRTVLTKAARTG